MINKKSVLIRILVLFLLLNFTLYPATGIEFEKKILENTLHNEVIKELQTEDVSPGDIIDISFSNSYPTLGKPIEILITLKGNPFGERFDEMLNISDDYEGLIAKSNRIEWKSASVSLDQLLVKIGRLPMYIKKIRWYPVVVGNHTLRFTAGSFPSQAKNVSVGFDTDNIIFPSIGCPSIINKGESEELSVALSEERYSLEDTIDIKYAKLESIDGSFTYVLDNQSDIFYTWIHAGEDKVEDELIMSYNIDSIPYGFYNISITTSKDNYTWPHAVKIIDEEPVEYTFVHLTDIHIGKRYNLINEKEELASVINYLNEEIKPDFVVMSGDLVDWYQIIGSRNFFKDIQDVIVTCNSPVFTTPGNHERYKYGILHLCFPFYNLSHYHSYLNPLNDYAFEYGNMNFVLLDSGYDWSRWEIQVKIWTISPEGSGLTNNQIYLLENEWGNNEMNQSIVMHHPAISEKDDTGFSFVPDDHPSGNNECIAFNRVELIDYCLANNVSLVLTGHTHRNKVFNYLGEEPNDLYEWPIFVQTDSTTLNGLNNGGRVVRIKDGNIESYDYVPLTYDDFFLT